MRIFYILFLVLISFQSCSTSNDSMNDGDEQMQMDEEMNMEEDMSGNASYSGNFVSSAHTTSGLATINESKTKLIFTNFSTENGPLLEVYLATNTSASKYISLGELKGISGNYEYDLPEEVDYTVYNHVIIWCVTFSVNFGYAVLN